MLLIAGLVVAGMWLAGASLLFYMAHFEFELIVDGFPESTFAFYYGKATTTAPFPVKCSQVVRYAGVVACSRKYVAKGVLEYQELMALPRMTRWRLAACSWLLLGACTLTLLFAWLVLG